MIPSWLLHALAGIGFLTVLIVGYGIAGYCKVRWWDGRVRYDGFGGLKKVPFWKR